MGMSCVEFSCQAEVLASQSTTFDRLGMSMNRMSRLTEILGLAGWLAASFVTGAVGGLASVNAPSFYGQLVQPAWAPPALLFGPVWSLLFVLMGVAAWLVWRKHGFRGAGVALGLFVAQLLANALWSWLFFAWQQGAMAFMEVMVLWVLIAATLRAFWRLHRAAALLLVPYLAWVSFAAVLNLALWQLNPALLG
jgi:tryptophan-rich sensory protein